jgi:hypothetical protein
LPDDKLATIVAGQRPSDLTPDEAVAYDVIGEPCGMPRRLSRAARACLPSSFIGFFYGAFQPHLDQMQHAPIDDSACYRF